MSARRGRLFTA